MSYLQYFGFDSEPFGHAPSSRFYYASAEHTQALRRLLHCMQSMQGLAILVGDIGRGKTTLARRLLESLPEASFSAALVVIVHKDIAPLWLIKHIATQLGVQEPADTAPDLIGQLYTQLMALRAAGRRAVVLIDEAQMLQTQALMEEFRGLLNLEVPGSKLISFVFFGLPSIEETLRLDPPLAQRVAMRYALQPLGAEATAEYVNHRLQVVGARWQIFSPDALAAIYYYSQGVPRVINTLCDNILLETFFAGTQVAQAELVTAVANNLSLAPGAALAPPRAPTDEAAALTAPWAAPEPPAMPPAAPPTAEAMALAAAAERADYSSVSGLPVASAADVPPGHVQLAAPMEPPETAVMPEIAPAVPVEDWSGLTAVGNLLSNTQSPGGHAVSGAGAEITLAPPAASSPQAAASVQPQVPVVAASPVDGPPSYPGAYAHQIYADEPYQANHSPEPDAAPAQAPVAQETQVDLAATAYGTLNLDEVTALLAQLNQQ